MIQKEKGKFYKNKLQETLNSPKSFWDVIKNIFPVKKDELKTPECVKTSEGISKDKYNIVHHFNQFFINVVSSLSDYFNLTSNTTYTAGEASPTNKLFDLSTTFQLLAYQQLKGLKTAKAMGLDMIST